MFNAILNHLRPEPPPEAQPEPPRYFWGPNTHCRKCGCPFFGHPENPRPGVQYVKSDEHGEKLKCTCPRCGYFWFVSPVEKD